MEPVPTDLTQLIEIIHNTPQLVVIEFAGAGAQAIAWLHGVGGSSRTVLEATDRYTSASLVELIGFEPEQFASLKVARAMAVQAYMRACSLAGAKVPTAGVGCTATIATDRQKRGEHRCCVAVCDARGVTTYNLVLSKGLRTRHEEENLVSLLIIQAVAGACGLSNAPQLPLQGEEKVQIDGDSADLLERLLNREFELVAVSLEGDMTPAQNLPNVALLSGAFNPLHAGHRKMAQAAADILGQDVYFELPLVNAAKGAIELNDARKRVAQFADLSPLLLSRVPLFNQKARLYPRSTFVLGADTAKRLLEPRFYQNSRANMLAALQEVRLAGCRFLVAGRQLNGEMLTLRDLPLPEGFRELFAEIPTTKFRLDISSTDLREGRGEAKKSNI